MPKKWNVSSTAIPMAALAVMIDPISIQICSQPINPKIATAGNTFGTMARRPAVGLRSTHTMTIAIIRNAMKKLSTRSFNKARCAL